MVRSSTAWCRAAVRVELTPLAGPPRRAVTIVPARRLFSPLSALACSCASLRPSAHSARGHRRHRVLQGDAAAQHDADGG